MRKFAIVCYMLLNVFLLVCSENHFRHGRSTGGNLGAPGDYSKDNVPQAQWFDQKVDHSTYSDVRTWKQVRMLPTRPNEFPLEPRISVGLRNNVTVPP